MNRERAAHLGRHAHRLGRPGVVEQEHVRGEDEPDRKLCAHDRFPRRRVTATAHRRTRQGRAAAAVSTAWPGLVLAGGAVTRRLEAG